MTHAQPNGPRARRRGTAPIRAWVGALGAAVLALAGTARAQTPYADLILNPAYRTYRYFPLGDASATTIFDRSPAAVHGQIVGPAIPVVGPLFDVPSGGGALGFNGLTSYATAPIASFGEAMNDPAGTTIIVWFRAFETSRGALLGTFNAPGPAGGFQLLLGANVFFYLPNDFQVTFSVNYSTGDWRTASFTSSDFASTDWHMLAATYRSGELRLYSDGEERRCTYFTLGGIGRIPTLTNPLTFGAVNDGSVSTPKTTQQAHVSLHSAALGAEQIRALWHAGNGYTGAAVFGIDALRPWLDAARTQRVDAALMSDSNTVFGSDAGGAYGHAYGMTQGARAVAPVYASQLLPGTGRGTWVNVINGVSPIGVPNSSTPVPEFIAQRVPTFEAGFSAGALYIDGATQIPGQHSARGPIYWEGGDLPFDFTSRIDFHLVHARFGPSWGAGGIMYPGVRRLFAPVTPLVEAVLPTSGPVDEIVESVLSIPAGPREPGQPYSLQVTDFARNLPALGPAAVLYSRLVLPDVSAGVAMTPMWGVGGKSARYAADKFVNATSLVQLSEYLRQLVRHQPAGSERLLIQIIEGGNDSNDPLPAINLDGTPAGVRSDTLAGQKLNTLTLLTRIRGAWMALGMDPVRLHFLLGPYHPAPITGPRIRSVYVRGWRELARDHPEFNITAMDGFGLSGIEEFYAQGWYNNSGADAAHLTRAGFLNFGVRTWQAIMQAAYPGPGPGPIGIGACCIGSTCVIATAGECIGTGRAFVGVGLACNPGSRPDRPCCKVDFNHDGAVGVQDVFEFLGAFFAGDVRADIDASGSVGVQDVFDFVTTWFSGC